MERMVKPGRGTHAACLAVIEQLGVLEHTLCHVEPPPAHEDRSEAVYAPIHACRDALEPVDVGGVQRHLGRAHIIHIDPDRIFNAVARAEVEAGAEVEGTVHVNRHRLDPRVVGAARIVHEPCVHRRRARAAQYFEPFLELLHTLPLPLLPRVLSLILVGRVFFQRPWLLVRERLVLERLSKDTRELLRQWICRAPAVPSSIVGEVSRLCLGE